MLGVLLIDKPLGITSHDVVNTVRKRFGTRRVGHAGTLDPLATGLLVVAVGPATRFLQYLPLEPKEYRCCVKFGVSTNTQDAEGEEVERRDVPADLEKRLIDVLPEFVGEIDQIPPMYSAVKVKGRALYDYARSGVELEREPRTIYIHEIELIRVDGDIAEMRVVCSGGTYVRTLAHDVGARLGCGAYLFSLVRTRVGRYDLSQAAQLDSAAPDDLLSLAEALPPLPLIQLNSRQVEHVRNGQAITVVPLPAERLVGLMDPEGHVISVGRKTPQGIQPDCVIPREALRGAL